MANMAHGEPGCGSPVALRQLMGSPVRVRFGTSPCRRSSKRLQVRCENFRVDKSKEEAANRQQQFQNMLGLDVDSICSSSGDSPAVRPKNLLGASVFPRTAYG